MRSFWELPGPRQFVSSIATQLSAAQNVVLCLPPGPPEGLIARLGQALAKEGIPWSLLSANTNKAENPLAMISAALLPAETAIALPLDMVRHRDLPEQVVLIDELSVAMWAMWSQFLTEYAHACRSLPDGARPRVVLCIIARGMMALSKNLPHEDTALIHCYYYGVVSRSDMLLYVASISAELNLSDLQRQLANAALFHIGQWDPQLCLLLAQKEFSRILNPRPILKTLARQRTWDGVAEPASWFNGGSDLYGPEERIHSAYYGLRDPDREIERRLRCAQMSILLPLVEERRPMVIQDWAQHLGSSFTNKEGQKIPQADMELGHIAHILNKDGHSSHEVQLLAHVRRNLAHITKLDSEELERLEQILVKPRHSLRAPRPREPR